MPKFLTSSLRDVSVDKQSAIRDCSQKVVSRVRLKNCDKQGHILKQRPATVETYETIASRARCGPSMRGLFALGARLKKSFATVCAQQTMTNARRIIVAEEERHVHWVQHIPISYRKCLLSCCSSCISLCCRSLTEGHCGLSAKSASNDDESTGKTHGKLKGQLASPENLPGLRQCYPRFGRSLEHGAESRMPPSLLLALTIGPARSGGELLHLLP